MDWNSEYEYIDRLVADTLREDVGAGDVTVAATIPEMTRGQARIVARKEIVCAGLPLAERVFRALDPQMNIEMRAAEGQKIPKGADVVRLDGKAAAILTGEGTALNFLGRLCGIATLTRQLVEEIAGTRAKIRDSRETTPGLRSLEKYAVKMGGGTNHRIGLFDAIVLKESHIAIAGGVRAALDQAHSYVSQRMRPRAMTAYEAVGATPSEEEASSLPIQIAVRNESELREALSAGAEAVLLDNMRPDQARACVEIVRSFRPDCTVEISGEITLANVRAYAETGADYLSSAALTHSAPNAGLSLLVDRLE